MSSWGAKRRGNRNHGIVPEKSLELILQVSNKVFGRRSDRYRL
jgi:hypothetical protein